MAQDILRGKNIRLRALEPQDTDTLYEWENDTSIWRVSNTVAPFSRFQIEQYVLNSQNDIFSSRALRLMIILSRTGESEIPAGTLDLFDFDPVNRRAGVGILIREQFRKQGLAREAMELLIRYCFGTLRLHQLYCNITGSNKPSLDLFEAMGFTRCGVKKEWTNDGKSWTDEWMFQLINPDE